MVLDSCTAILFARLRYEHKALKFAIFKTIKIFTEIGANLLLFLVVPNYLKNNPDSILLNVITATPDFSYVLFAIFISCIVAGLLFIPTLINMRYPLDKRIWKMMMIYSIPLMIAGLPGILNDFLDRILFRFFNIGTDLWRSELGIFQAVSKLAVIMSLFIQMFRFAAEPFFFAQAKEKGSKELYALVMEYFVAFCMLIFLSVLLYIDILQYFIGADFRAGLGVVPILLFSYVLLGMLYNVSMWYKLSGKTTYAIYITFSGLIVTTLINLFFLPIYSYWAAAVGHLASYLVMFCISLYLGNKYYPIPYRWRRIVSFIIVALLIYTLSQLMIMVYPDINLYIKLTINTLLILAYLLYVIKAQKISLIKILKK